MADGEDQKHEYYIKLLSFIIGPATETLHLYFEMKVLNTLDFFSFLEKHKHVLFHELNPSIPCCECQKVHIAAAKKKNRLIDTQFYLLFEKDEGRENKDHVRTQGHQIKQLCLCSISANGLTTVDMMDITLLSVVIKSCCPPGSISGHPSWIKDIKTTRNFLAHCPSGKITKTEFDQRFSITEQSVLNLARVVGSTCLKLIKSQISYFQKSELSTIRDIIKNSNDSIRQILGLFVEEQKNTIESIADQTRNLAENTDAMKTEVLTQLQEQKRIAVDIQKIVFEVKTVLKSQQAKSTDPSKKIVSHDDGVCYVEWKLETPGSWNIDAIKGTLENFSSLMGSFFRIVFVYKGSLVIQTTAPICFLQNEKDLQLAVKLFLGDLVDVCKLDSDTKTIVKVEVVLSQETFASHNVPEKMTISTFACDPCSNKNVSSEAVQYCYECQNKFCQQCIKTHNLNAAFLQHSLTDTGTLSFENSCAKHERNTLDFYCVEHDCLCCSSCIPEEHTSCQKLVPLKDAAKDILQSSMFQDVSNALSNITVLLDKAITSQDDNIECLDNDEVAIIDQVASNKAVIINRLDELETKLKQDTYALKKEQKTEFESAKNYLLQIMKPMKNISDKINEVFKNGSHEQMFVLINKCKLEILYYENQLHEFMPTLETRRLTFKPPDHIQNAVKSLGSTNLRSLQYNTQYNADYKRPKMEPVQIPFSVSQMPSKFTLDRKIEIKHSRDIWISNMGITYDNRLLLCNFYSKDLLVYSDHGDYLQDCKLSGESWDIAVIPDDDKAVVTQPLQQSIQFINIKTMTAGSIHYVPGDCYSICIVNDTICVGGHKGYLYIVNKQGDI
ncbi:unnamed protein product [Mytilus coruscus]|uniref:B box-type domain-containing protein n=1 Tax=Mytilus coruscus TaxID=42192 RepID=A0A6J8A671_MYTCO|nr:unnamed protein product [Mytilus coruscus]